MKLIPMSPSTFTTSVTGTALDMTEDAGAPQNTAIASLFISAGFTGTAITWEASMDGSTWFPVIDTAGAAVSYACTGGTVEAMAVPPTDLCGFPHLRPISNTTITTGSITPVVRPV